MTLLNNLTIRGAGFFQSLLRYSTSTKKRHVLRQDVSQLKVHKIRPPAKGFDARVYVWGLAETGALGNEKNKDDHQSKHTSTVTAPTRQQFAEQHHVTDIACGYGFSAFVVQEENGTHSVYGTGINTDGQLGLQLSRQSKQMELLIYPSKIPLEPNLRIRSIDAGRAHLVMVTDSNTVLALGNNSYGQAARKIIKDEDFKIGSQVHKFSLGGETVTDVTCGQDHTVLLSKSGRVFSCGWGSDGQTGLGHYKISSKPQLVEGDVKNEKIVKVASTADCVLALNDKGDVFGWGNSEYGQFNKLAGLDVDDQQIHTPRHLFSGEKYGRIVDIAAGGSFCLALNEAGEVFSWGYGVLGFGPEVSQLNEPKKLPPTLFGRNDFNPNSRVTSIYAGLFHMGAVTNDQDLYVWGVNRFGCLGLGDKRQTMFFPFKVAVNAKVKKMRFGADHTVALCEPFVKLTDRRKEEAA